MTLPKILWFSILPLFGCSSGQQRKPHADTSQQSKTKDTSDYADLYPLVKQDLNKKNLSANGNNYYMLRQFSDSTAKITWGNDTINRVYDEPLDFMFAERLRLKWENENYMILDYNTGSGAWLNIVFPLNNKEQVQGFGNGLCFDKKYNLLVTEEFKDTLLEVHNLKTLQKQFIIEKEKPCNAATNDACIDTISISNKVLYYKLVTPNKYSDMKKSVEKHVRVTI